MMQEAEIRQRLESSGLKISETGKIMQEVGLVIAAKAMFEYVKTLPEELQEKIKALSPQESEAFFKENRSILPRFPQEVFDKIHDEIWLEYFSALSKE